MDVKITDNSKTFIGSMKDAKEAALIAIGMKAAEYAARLAPVDTGRLKNSIDSTYDDDSAYVGTNVEYAAYVEFGTSRMRAQPYLKPAATGHADEYKAIAERIFKDASE